RPYRPAGQLPRPAGGTAEEGVPAPARTPRPAWARAHPRPPAAGAVRLGRGDREQRARGAHPPPAQEAVPGADPHRARRGLPGGQGLMRSIRSRTLLLVLGLLAVALSVISYVSYRDARHEIEELFDAVLAQQARLLAGMISADMAPDARLALQQALDGAVVGTSTQGASEADDEEARPLGHEYESKLGFVVLDDAGNSLLQSASAPVGALERLLAELPRTAEVAGVSGGLASVGARLAGYHTVQMPDGDWRLFVLQDARDRQWILVG